MARLHSSGWELGSDTDGVEWGDVNGAGASTQTTTVRSGTYAGKILNPATGVRTGWAHRFSNAAIGIFYYRFYFRLATAPNVLTTIAECGNAISLGADVSGNIRLRLNTSGQLILRDVPGASDLYTHTAFTVNTWYRVEVFISSDEAGGSNDVELRIDGSSAFTSGNRTFSTDEHSIRVGANLAGEACTTGEWYFDDLAVNDTSAGGTQTSWPGAGSIIHLYPNAAGDFAEGTGNGYLDIDEVTPDDATTFHTLVDPSTGSTDADRLDVNIENFSTKVPGGADSIACYQVGVRVEQEANSFVLRTKRGASGTLRESGTVTIAAAVAWTTHDDTAGTKQYKLTRYVDPEDNTSALTSSMMDDIQIGIRAPDATPDLQVTSMWALVDYVPTAVSGDAVPQVWAQYRRRRVGCI